MRTISAKALIAAAICGLVLAPAAEAAGGRGPKARRAKSHRSVRAGAIGTNAGTFANCAEARAAGAAPIRRGQLGYSRRLDRDGDGVACER